MKVVEASSAGEMSVGNMRRNSGVNSTGAGCGDLLSTSALDHGVLSDGGGVLTHHGARSWSLADICRGSKHQPYYAMGFYLLSFFCIVMIPPKPVLLNFLSEPARRAWPAGREGGETQRDTHGYKKWLEKYILMSTHSLRVSESLV